MMIEYVFLEKDSSGIKGNRDTKSVPQVIETPHELVHPQTVGELRTFLEPFSDECKLMLLNCGAFRFVIDEHGNGTIRYTLHYISLDFINNGELKLYN